MAGGHSHSAHDRPAAARVGGRARWVLLAFLAVAAGSTVMGLVLMWPGSDPRPNDAQTAFAAPGVTFPDAEVLGVQPACPRVTTPEQGSEPSRSTDGAAAPAECGHISVLVSTGAARGTRTDVPVAPEVTGSGLRAGDSVRLLRTPAAAAAPSTLSFFGVNRTTPLWILGGLFLLTVAAVARLRGLLALVGLAFGGFVLVRFMLPALLTGASGLGVALVGSSAIMFVVLYLAHGVSLRTSAALAGTLVGVLITALVGVVAVRASRLSGIPDESGAILSSFAGDVNFQGLLTAAVIIAGLGILNDVTITQTSAVWELRAADPGMNRRTLFTSAMRIGRDHIASTIYTIVFAYAGTALTVLLLLFLYERPLLDLLSTEDIAEEITRTFASGIGLVLAVPVTTAIAAAVVAPRSRPRE